MTYETFFFIEEHWKSINERERRFFNRKKSRKVNSLIDFISQQGNKNAPTRSIRVGDFSFPAMWNCFKTLSRACYSNKLNILFFNFAHLGGCILRERPWTQCTSSCIHTRDGWWLINSRCDSMRFYLSGVDQIRHICRRREHLSYIAHGMHVFIGVFKIVREQSVAKSVEIRANFKHTRVICHIASPSVHSFFTERYPRISIGNILMSDMWKFLSNTTNQSGFPRKLSNLYSIVSLIA